jgi:predicted DNA-binding transcriptional regulator AlpA
MEMLVLDTPGAAARVGLAAGTLEKMRVYGDGPPFIKLGRAVRYRVSDLDAWVGERLFRSTSERAA